ncbi:MAG TPA: choice-of-anchor V domain-containing protein [Gammaproteobacteria bacterium]|nr:choice-of-anchor V domain-containing protein [Gammaproteobacteria bacterium]
MTGPSESHAAPIALIGAASLLAAFLAAPAPASPDGAEWETADNPEGCLACHLGAPVMTESEGLAIEGLPRKPIPGRAYALSITLADPELQNAGFLLRIAAVTGSPGALEALDTQTETNGALARSTFDGATPAEPGRARWQLEWTAPEPIEAPLRFELWANAGNWDLSPLGDRLHRRSFELAPPRAP